MRKWIKAAGWLLLGLLLAGGITVLAALQMASRKMERSVQVQVPAVQMRSDAQAAERGKYLYASRGCVDCHGATGGGHMFIDADGLRVRGPNISPSPQSAVAAYKPEDWVRAIRHGVHPSGRPLMVMPSEDYNRLTDEDLASLVAYLKAMPPAEGGPGIVDLPVPVRVLYGVGYIKDAAAKIDHALPPSRPVPEAVSVEHGKYVANMCIGCHGAQLAGGRIPGGPPDWPPASRLAPGEGSVMPRYAQAEAMLALFRTGKRPDGSAVKVMPFDSLRHVSETDVRALHLYLTSLAGARQP